MTTSNDDKDVVEVLEMLKDYPKIAEELCRRSKHIKPYLFRGDEGNYLILDFSDKWMDLEKMLYHLRNALKYSKKID